MNVNHEMAQRTLRVGCLIFGLIAGVWATKAAAQSVCLPAPRLLTTWPMGGQAGTEVAVKVTGEHAEDIEGLLFSHPGLSAVPRTNDAHQVVPNEFLVSIRPDTPQGIYEARLLSRLGVSSARIFSVGELPETTVVDPHTTLETATELQVNSVCNAVASNRAVDYFSFSGVSGQRLLIECCASGIDSKLKPVVIVADETGRDLVVERGGDVLDFEIPQDGVYVIKVHDLTFQGGPAHFYRLVIREVPKDAAKTRLPGTFAVSSFSWPPAGLSEQAPLQENEPNDGDAEAQRIELPCDLSGRFYPAADVDTFEFSAKQGEIWWVEIASERLGRPTDPSLLVQEVHRGADGTETLVDVVEMTDIASPVKPSSNQYAYDGPPYDGGSPDILAAINIPRDGEYRLKLRDLFGGTRSDLRNEYRLVIRQAEPDFALVAWALHMELRNGDRNALSKPIALRNGATMPLEVVVVRRDGFDGPIDMVMDQLPEGVTATGLRIPAGQTRGVMLITASEDAPRGWTQANFVGRAEIAGTQVVRPCRLASMAWPVKDHWQEIPQARLLGDVAVSVGGGEAAPLTIAPAENKIWEVEVGEKLTIPLQHVRRSDFSGATITLKTIGEGFSQLPVFDAPLTADSSEVILDLATLKTPPGDYHIAFYGNAVAKYRYNPTAVILAETAKQKAEQAAKAAAEEARRLGAMAQAASPEEKAAAEQAAQAALAKQQAAEAAVAEAAKQLDAAVAKANPQDIVDIIVSEPITIRVKPAEKS